MREVVVLIPDIEADQNIEIDVRISGKTQSLKYRVELVRFDNYNLPNDDRVNVIRHIISDYDKNWELVEIGSPTKTEIPLMFRQKPSTSVKAPTLMSKPKTTK